jgi:hypothetical protein
MILRKNTQTEPHYEGETVTLKDKGNDEFEITIGASDSEIGLHTYAFDKDTILLDHKTKQAINTHHSISALAVHDSGTIKATDLFKHTKHNKSGVGGIKTSLDLYPVVFVFIPFVDSSTDDWTLVVNSSAATNEGSALASFNVDNGRSISVAAADLFPSISMSKDGTDISATIDPVKENVEIYFETTGGYLNKTRVNTNSSGVATCTVVGAAEGKVKAGFKHFTGKAEISI